VAIVGVGLLGTSLGLALKDRKLAQGVVGVGRKGSASLKVAQERGAIDEAFTEAAEGVAGCDLVVLCTPIRQFPTMFEAVAPVLGEGAIVTDVGSTKSEVVLWAGEALRGKKSGAVFVGSHPMAGSEKRGPEFGRADLYQGAMCLMCTEPSFQQGASYKLREGSLAARTYAALLKVEAMWRAVGMRTLRLSCHEHDRWVATISHLPHAVAFSLVNAAARRPEMLQAVAGGFIDTTRVASSDLEMWTDIFLTNRDAVVGAIDAFGADLMALKEAIRTGDEAVIRTMLSSAKEVRDGLVKERTRRNSNDE
jgi:prephenate dehydrogenase